MAGNLNVQQTFRAAQPLDPLTRPQPTTLGPSENPSQEAVAGQMAPKSVDAPRSLSANELKDAVERLDNLARLVRRELHFSVDETSGRFVIKIVDGESNEVIRQVPPEKVLDLLARFEDFKSVLVSEEA